MRKGAGSHIPDLSAANLDASKRPGRFDKGKPLAKSGKAMPTRPGSAAPAFSKGGKVGKRGC